MVFERRELFTAPGGVEKELLAADAHMLVSRLVAAPKREEPIVAGATHRTPNMLPILDAASFFDSFFDSAGT